MDDDLYSDNDPEYRATRVASGIPPPSARERRRNPRQADSSRYNTNMQRHQQRHNPYGRDDRRQPPDQQQYNNRGPYDGPRYDNQQRHLDQRYPDQRYPDQRRPEQRYSDQRYPDQRYSEQRRPEQRHESQGHAEHRQYPDQRYAEQQQSRPPAPKPKPLDMRTSTDFLKCEKRLSLEDLITTIQLSPCSNDVDYNFLSSSALVEKVNQLRESTRNAPYEQVSQARSKSNPYERVGNSIFMNRAATKMAALDATFGLAATKGRQEFTFADICGGPGGFSEYLLWRVHSWGESAHGFGITLKGKDEVNWHTEKFRPDIPRHSLTQVNGHDGTGDLYKKDNIRQFEATVMKETNEAGVDLVVADGGFDFSGNEGHQELSAQRLLLCEIITMLTCLRKDGHFVCKFFDILSESTASLIWLLYQVFDQICITKPLSSRPANAERYIVCKGLMYEHPTRLVSKLLEAIDGNTTPISVVPKNVMEKDEDLIDYIKMRNIRFTMKQTEALELMGQFIQNPNQAPLYDQEQVKRHCLNEWRLPLQDTQHTF